MNLRNLKDKEIRIHGVKHNGKGETVIKPWQDLKTRIATVILICVALASLGGIYAQAKKTVTNAAKVDSLELEIDCLYAADDSNKALRRDRNRSQMRLMKAIVQAVMPNKQDAEALIVEVEIEMMEVEEYHAEALK